MLIHSRDAKTYVVGRVRGREKNKVTGDAALKHIALLRLVKSQRRHGDARAKRLSY